MVNGLVEEINQKGINHPDVLKQLRQREITHVYIGQQQGLVNSISPMLNLEEIAASPNFKEIYHQDRVWIFEVQSEKSSTLVK